MRKEMDCNMEWNICICNVYICDISSWMERKEMERESCGGSVEISSLLLLLLLFFFFFFLFFFFSHDPRIITK